MRMMLALTLLGLAAVAQADDGRVYEMRVYYAAPGKLDALHARFRDHTCKLFEKHGMTNLGYFTPLDNLESKLIYVLSYPSRAARDASWKAFLADPDWKQAYAASEVDGKLVAKIETYFMATTDYSPSLEVADVGNRVFELRHYTATPGNLALLNARFRDHTCALFAKHGMTNVVYWNLLPGETGADTELIYLLAHASPEAAKASFGGFRDDPGWTKARTESEAKAGGSLTARGGVRSTLMQPTDYSPLK